MKIEDFLSDRWKNIRHICVLVFLVLSLLERSIMIYYTMLPFIFIGFMINLMQFIAKTRAGLYDNIFRRIYDIIMLILFLFLLFLVIYIIYTSECPVCQI